MNTTVADSLPTPTIPVSWGELIDKITILEIKSDRLHDAAARNNVVRELQALLPLAAPAMQGQGIELLKQKLRALNEAIWEIEDAIREKERERSFDHAFVALARSVYRTNDERAAIKRRINVELRSHFLEEKGYSSY
ncbi:MAG: DUF6165 family protein [Beijerinckiaceae bacterium]